MGERDFLDDRHWWEEDRDGLRGESATREVQIDRERGQDQSVAQGLDKAGMRSKRVGKVCPGK